MNHSLKRFAAFAIAFFMVVQTCIPNPGLLSTVLADESAAVVQTEGGEGNAAAVNAEPVPQEAPAALPAPDPAPAAVQSVATDPAPAADPAPAEKAAEALADHEEELAATDESKAAVSDPSADDSEANAQKSDNGNSSSDQKEAASNENKIRLGAKAAPDSAPKAAPDAGDGESEGETEGGAEDDDETKYAVTFRVDGDDLTILSIIEGTAIGADLPSAPEKTGYRFDHWENEAGMAVTEDTIVTRDMVVDASYVKVWNVTFSADGNTTEITVDDNTAIGSRMPADPEKEFFQFDGWFSGETPVTAETAITADITATAAFSANFHTVTFVEDKDGDGTFETTVTTKRVTKADGAKVGTLPETPFVAGKDFLGWTDESGNIVTADTPVTRDMEVRALFDDVHIYKVTIEYYYLRSETDKKVFDSNILYVDGSKIASSPVTVDSPSDVEVDDAAVSYHDAQGKTFYPEKTSVTIDSAALEDHDDENNVTIGVKYIPYTATYSFVYRLQKLSGDGFDEIEREDNVEGVLGSTVTPTAKTYPYATLISVEPVKIEQESGQELYIDYARKTFTLTFNSLGGSNIPSQSAVYGTEIDLTDVAAPERRGYTFKGWYKDQEGSQAAGDSIVLKENTTLYAKWEGANVNYTIVYLFEKFNAAGTEASFVYDNAEIKTAKVGSTVRATDSSIPDKTRAGWEKDNSQNAASSTVIKADGSSVLYVYYKLREYTFRFNAGIYQIPLTILTDQITATLVDQKVTGKGLLSYSMTPVKLGQDISAAWPYNVTGRGILAEVNFTGWRYGTSGTNYATKRLVVTTDMLPSSGDTVTYYAQWILIEDEQTVNYWLQNADDNGYTKSEKYSQKYTKSAIFPSELSAKEIDGYIYDHERNTQSEYNFYYNRLSYDIIYYNGSDKLKTVENIKFDADISGAAYNWTPAPPTGMEDYEWGGWYADDTLITPYTFSKMPANDLPLYAKWIAPVYTVNFHSNYPEADDLFDTQQVSKNDYPEDPGIPEREYHMFDGWYTEAEGGTRYTIGAASVTGDLDLYAHWVLNPLQYTVRYLDQETGDELYPEKVVDSAALTYGQTVTEKARAIAGYLPDSAEKTLELGYDADENVITFLYGEKKATNKYSVYYVLKDNPEIAVAKPDLNVEIDGATTSITLPAKEPDPAYMTGQEGVTPQMLEETFHPEDVTKTLTLAQDEAQNKLYFYYIPYGAVKFTINRVDMDGVEIPGTHTKPEILQIGATKSITTSLKGYTLYSNTDDNGGSDITRYSIEEPRDITVTLMYKTNLTVKANDKAKPYDGKELVSSTNSDAQISGLISGDVIEVGYEGGQTEVGSSETFPYVESLLRDGKDISDYYNIETEPGTLTVSRANVVINVLPDRWTGNVYNGESKTAGFTNGAKSLEDYVVITDESYKEAHLSDFAALMGMGLITEKDAGTHTYEASKVRTLVNGLIQPDDNYRVTLYVRESVLEILPAPLTLTSATLEKPYDGTELTNGDAALTERGWVGSEGAAYTFTGSVLLPGDSAPNDFTITPNEGTKLSNYAISKTAGTLSITDRPEDDKLAITVKAVSSKGNVYDGTEKSAEGFETLSFDVNGVTFTVSGLETSDPASTDVCELTNAISGTAVVKDAEDNDVTAQFDVTTEDGVLEIIAREVTVSAADADDVMYDGNEHTGVETPEFSNIVKGQTASISYTPAKGTTAASYTGSFGDDFKVVDAAGEDVTKNYSLTDKTPGSLTITDRSEEDKYQITVTANSNTGNVYDGTEKTAEGFETLEFTIDGNTYTVSGLKTSDPASVDVCELPNEISGAALVKDARGRDVTDQFTVTTEDGLLEISAREITVSVADASDIAYDGSEHTGSETPVFSNVVDGQTASISYTPAKGTVADTYTGSFGDDLKVIDAEGKDVTKNYSLTDKTPGSLTITDRAEDDKYQITVTANSNTGNVYDGTVKSAEGFETLEFTIDGNTYTVSGLETSDPVSADVCELANEISGTAVVSDAAGRDVTAQFEVATEDGTLEITAREITVSVADAADVVADGSEHTGNETPTFTNVVSGQTASISYTPAKGTEAGKYTGSFGDDLKVVDAEGKDVTKNYALTSKTPGSMTIKADGNGDGIPDEDQTFKVVYDLAGGQTTSEATEFTGLKVGDTTPTIEEPTKEKAVFSAWEPAVAATVAAADAANSEDKLTITYTAQWKPDENEDGIPDEDQTFKVVYDLAGGQTTSETTEFTGLKVGDATPTIEEPTKEKAVFSAWEPAVAATVAAADAAGSEDKLTITYTAQWKPDENEDGIPDEDQTFKVVYDLAGGQTTSEATEFSGLKVGDTTPTIEEPTKEKAVFSAWEPAVAATVAAADAAGSEDKLTITYTAQWKPDENEDGIPDEDQTFKVVYDLAGGQTSSEATEFTGLKVGDATPTIEEPTKEKAVFSAWEPAVAATVAAADAAGSEDKLTITYTAQWKPDENEDGIPDDENVFKVVYDLAGGQTTSEATEFTGLKVGDTTPTIEEPTKEKAVFSAWDPAVAATVEAADAANSEDKLTITYTAQWKPDENEDGIPDEDQTFKVVYDLAGGQTTSEATEFSGLKVGDATPTIEDPTKEKAVFSAWEPAVAATVAAADAANSEDKLTITYTAQWKPDENEDGIPDEDQTFKVVYDLAGGQTTSEATEFSGLKVGDATPTIEDPTKEKAVFSAWEPAVAATVAAADAAGSEDKLTITYTAQWKPDENEDGIPDEDQTFKVVYDLAGGQTSSSSTEFEGLKVGDTTPTIEDPTKEKAVFSAWEPAVAATVAAADAAGSEDKLTITYTAQWKPDENEDGIPDEDQTFKVVYDLAGGQTTSEATEFTGLKVGDATPTIEEPTKEKAVFSAWEPAVAATVAAADAANSEDKLTITYTAQWKPDENEDGIPDEDQTFKVVYDLAGGQTTSETTEFTGLKVGDTTPTIEEPTKEKAVFSAWEPAVAATVAAADAASSEDKLTITYTAQWTDDEEVDPVIPIPDDPTPNPPVPPAPNPPTPPAPVTPTTDTTPTVTPTTDTTDDTTDDTADDTTDDETAEDTTIEDEDVPLAEEANTDDSRSNTTETGTTLIDDGETPLAGGEGIGDGYWALLNLIAAIVTALISLALLLTYFGKKKEDDDSAGGPGERSSDAEAATKRRGIVRLCSLIPAVGGIVTFLLTEDMGAKMAFVDKWTVLMAVILAVNVVLAILSRKKTEKPDDQQGEGQTA